MKRLSVLLCTMCASLILVGCSYFDTSETVEVEKPDTPAKIDLMKKSDMNENVDVSEIARRSTHGSVQVFDLDGASEQVRYYDPASAAGRNSRVNSLDPNVQVFPLDGEHQAITPSQNLPWQGSTLSTSAPIQSTPISSGNGVVYFEHGETGLDDSDMGVINQTSSKFQQAPQTLLSVEGHASREAVAANLVQRKIINLKTSMNRALSVARSLIQKGVPAESIRTVAWGETQPPADGSEMSARRVEIISQ